jgi:hypothetical protein
MNELEIELIDYGNACVETKQWYFAPTYFDSVFSTGARPG